MEEVENMSRITKVEEEEEDDDVPLPGFRFHPTDEELVGFYLRKKVEKRAFSIQLIKQIDIYKYDPWDLPKSSNVGEKEWYFFCKRGRKYRNSIRPNRVTGSGFWKATGIDRPIYSATAGENNQRQCIGLKKSLVYYRGSAGKGTKTEWMMHEFRLPAEHDKSTKHIHTKTIIAQEAEVWTVCRILKRSVSYKRDWKEISSAKRSDNPNNTNKNVTSNTYNNMGSCCDDQRSDYISFNNNNAPLLMLNNNHMMMTTNNGCNNSQLQLITNPVPVVSAPDIDELLKREDYWDEIITQLF